MGRFALPPLGIGLWWVALSATPGCSTSGEEPTSANGEGARPSMGVSGTGGGGGVAPSSTDCLPADPPPECLVRLYPDCDFGGEPVCLSAEGYHDEEALTAAGLPPETLSSLQVAHGYYARLHYTDNPDDGWDVFKRSEDSCLADDDVDDRIRHVTVQRRTVCRPRPRVFMAMHGANTLARDELDDQWTYVREHLDGIWNNAAGISIDEQAAIWRKITTRVMIQEQDRQTRESNWGELRLYGGVQGQFPDLQIRREAMALYKGYAEGDAVELWNADDVEVARREYVTHPDYTGDDAWMLFEHIYGGWQPFPFMDPADNPDRLLLDGTEAETVFDQAEGHFVECGGNACRGHLRRALLNAWSRTHEGDRPFIWFNGVGTGDHAEWFQATQNQYLMLEAHDVLHPDDVVMIINYSERLTHVPEVDPATGQPALTVTGILYWLLHQ